MQKNYLPAEIKNKDGEIEGIASTSVMDRQNETVNVDGWDLKYFKKNPVLLWAHDHNEPAIGKVTSIKVEGDGKQRALKFKAKFSDATDRARAIKTLVEEGIINSFSVGFKALEMDGSAITKQELLELSVVNVPANPQAMLLAYKSLDNAGFDKQTIEAVGIKQTPSATNQYVTSSGTSTTSWSPNINNVDSSDDGLEELKKRVKALETKTDLAVKGLKHLAPQRSTDEVATSRLALSKVIARASDNMLAGKYVDDNATSMLRVIKRSSELLIRSHKEDLNGKNQRT